MITAIPATPGWYIVYVTRDRTVKNKSPGWDTLLLPIVAWNIVTHGVDDATPVPVIIGHRPVPSERQELTGVAYVEPNGNVIDGPNVWFNVEAYITHLSEIK